MDAVVAAAGTIPEMKTFRADLRARLAAQGRDPDSCKVMFVFVPTLGETNEEAEARAERRQERRRRFPEDALAQMASLTDIDFAQFDLDAPVQQLTTNGQQGTLARFMKQGCTLREIAANYRFGFEDAVGMPDRVAGIMGEVMEEVGGDGFMVSGSVTRRYVSEVTDGLVPTLRRRGLVRTGYASEHFRDNLLEF